MASISIGERSLITSPQRDEYGRLRQKYREIAVEEQRRFLANYSSRFHTADDLYQRLPATIGDLIQRVTGQALTDITTHQIYDVDEEAFAARLAAKDGMDDGYKQFQDDYLAILLPSAKLEAERVERQAGRGGFVGGGFGVEGAARGMVLAAGANAAVGMIRGIAEHTTKTLAAAGDKRKKQDLLSAEATKSQISDTIYQVAFGAHEIVAEIVNEHVGQPIYELVLPAHRDKARAILKNVTHKRVPADQQSAVLLEAITLDPFVPEVWSEWLENLGDEDGSLEIAAATVGAVDLQSRKLTLVEREYNRLPRSTPEECISSLALLDNFASGLSAPLDTQREALTSTAKLLDVERRSYNGVVYDTPEEATEARASEEDRAARTCDGVLYDTAELAKQAGKDSTIDLNSLNREEGMTIVSKPTLWQRLWWNPNPTRPPRLAKRPIVTSE